MSVRPYAHTPNNDSNKAAFYTHKPKGINKEAPAPFSKTQARKANRLSGKHQPYKK